jgi:hypothetical protein
MEIMTIMMDVIPLVVLKLVLLVQLFGQQTLLHQFLQITIAQLIAIIRLELMDVLQLVALLKVGTVPVVATLLQIHVLKYAVIHITGEL